MSVHLVTGADPLLRDDAAATTQVCRVTEALLAAGCDAKRGNR